MIKSADIFIPVKGDGQFMEHETKPYELFRSVTRMFAFGDEEWRYFVEMTSVKHVKRGTQLIKAGERVNYAYFCMEGLFRLYYTLEDGKEYNKSFSFENDFVTSYGAMITGEPSYFSVEALEDSTVIEISYRLLQELMERSHTWESLVRKAVEQLYLKKEERERHLLYFDATKRYQAFKDQYPRLLNRVPQYHIATYLGISPVSLSRLQRASKS